MPNRRALLAAAAGLTTAMMVAACGNTTNSGGGPNGTSPTTSTGASNISLVTPGQLTVCGDIPYAPFSYQKNGKYVGFDLSVLRLVADRLNLRMQVIAQDFPSIASAAGLQARKCDVAQGPIYVTPERAKVMTFSHPYLPAKIGLIVKPASNAKSLSDLKGGTIAALQGSSSLAYAQAHQKAGGYQVKTFEDLGLIMASLQSGQVDAAMSDLAALAYYGHIHPGVLKVIDEFDAHTKCAFATKKNANPQLNKVINDVIARIKADGTLTKLYHKWVGNAGSPSC